MYVLKTVRKAKNDLGQQLRFTHIYIRLFETFSLNIYIPFLVSKMNREYCSNYNILVKAHMILDVSEGKIREVLSCFLFVYTVETFDLEGCEGEFARVFRATHNNCFILAQTNTRLSLKMLHCIRTTSQNSVSSRESINSQRKSKYQT